MSPGTTTTPGKRRPTLTRVQPRTTRSRLSIVPIDALVGEHVFYVQETAADDPRRVTVQRLFMFGVGQEGDRADRLALTEPLRWRDAQLTPTSSRA